MNTVTENKLKKSFGFLILCFVFCALIMLYTTPLYAFAGTTSLHTDNSKADIGVYVKFKDNTNRNHISIDENGNGSLTLPDGTQIEINGADENNMRLMVDPITEKNAIEWLCGTIPSDSENTTAYHIYYIDAKGNTVPADGVTVTLTPKVKNTNIICYSVNPDSETKNISFKIENNAITFTVNGDPYYAIVEKTDSASTSNNTTAPDITATDEGNADTVTEKSDGDNTDNAVTPSTDINSQTDKTDSNGIAPQTGDSGITLWIILLTISGLALLCIIIYGKKSKS